MEKKKKHPLHGYGYGSSSNLEQVQVITLKEVDSTNSYLRNLPADKVEKEFVAVVAKSQTAGRGQRGNSWESAPNKNLTFSIMMHPTFLTANEQFILSQAMALSVKETLDDYVRSPHPRIKWPNDIYWNKKKLCGILIETDLMGKNMETCIIGVGINLNQETFHSDAPNPVSVWQITGHATEPLTIMKKIIQRFVTYYNQIRQGQTHDLIDHYHKGLFRRVGYHLFRQGDTQFDARIRGVKTDGHLLLEDREGNIRTFGFKEVEYVI
ncbi:MAG: biotin--[Bacteroidaceae bacterium]|nr:biotin--[acetyl-CoA-carboxylase] ligase [Bacteroidaceae bacterium]